MSAIILNGGLSLHREIARLVTGLGLRLPIVATDLGTFATASAVAAARGRVTAASERKIDTAIELMERHVDTAELLERLAIPIPTVTTPQVFAYQLMERARTDPKRIVLPEGTTTVLQAAGRILRRGLAHLTILGEETRVRARAAELGVDLSAATVLNPQTSELCELFAAQYVELRKKKGVTLEQAGEIIRDVSYFGTMLVHNDIVDGMVSGAAHTTAHTVRPAFEIIKTQPGVSTVSSIFLMCLSDQVLAYGDCAIVPQLRPPRNSPTSRSVRRGPPLSSASNPEWPCCPIPPGSRGPEPVSTKSGPQPNSSGSGIRHCWSRGRFSMTQPSVPRWRRRRCPARRWPAALPC